MSANPGSKQISEDYSDIKISLARMEEQIKNFGINQTDIKDELVKQDRKLDTIYGKMEFVTKYYQEVCIDQGKLLDNDNRVKRIFDLNETFSENPIKPMDIKAAIDMTNFIRNSGKVIFKTSAWATAFSAVVAFFIFLYRVFKRTW